MPGARRVAGGLIVLHDGKPRAVGESQGHHNLYPTSARLIEGEPLEVVSYKVDMRGKHLAWLLERIDRTRTYVSNSTWARKVSRCSCTSW